MNNNLEDSKSSPRYSTMSDTTQKVWIPGRRAARKMAINSCFLKHPNDTDENTSPFKKMKVEATGLGR